MRNIETFKRLGCSDPIALYQATAVRIDFLLHFFGEGFLTLSGPAIKPVALAKVNQVYNAVKIPIIGIGGIMNYP